MYEKILSLLSAKFAQARKDGLQQLARSIAIQAADDSEAQALVDKLNVDKVTDYIKDWRKDVDSEVTNATRTHENNLKTKYDFVDKGTSGKTTPEDPKDIAAMIENSISKAIKPLQDKVNAFEIGKTIQTRKQTLESKLKDAPEILKKSTLKNFERMNFESEDAFNDYLTELEGDVSVAIQEAANSSLKGFPTPGFSASGNVAKDKVNADIKNWADSEKKQEENK